MPQSLQTSAAATDGRFRFPASLATAVEKCWAKAAAPADWNLSRQQFEQALARCAAHAFSLPHSAHDGTSPELPLENRRALEAYLEGLHAADFALACACSAGNPVAWDFFVAKFRPELYRAARAIAGEQNARDLADSLYAELYGLRGAGGERKSLFDYFHGRSKLSTWLRAILSQRYVDQMRRSRGTESLDDDSEEPARKLQHAVALRSIAPDTERERYLVMLQATLSFVLSAIDARDRLRLAYYYVNDMTLAQIGKLLGEHEATVSRKLERTRREIYRRVESVLRSEKRLTEEQIRLCFEHAREEWPFDLTRVLAETK